MLTWCTYFKPDGHEWNNKKGLVHFLLFDFKLEETKKMFKNQPWKKNVLSAGALTTLTSYQCCSCRMLYNLIHEYLGLSDHHSNSFIESYCQAYRAAPKTLYVVTSYAWMLPVHYWWNSIPFSFNTELWESNIDDFRTIVN